MPNPTTSSAGTRPSLTLTREIKAPASAVFAAWTDPSKLTKWFGPEGIGAERVEVDLRVGGSYEVEMKGPDGKVYLVRGVYREITEPTRLVFTWAWDSPGWVGKESVVTIELEEDEGVTTLTLTHVDLLDEDAKTSHREGWVSTLNRLEALVS